MFLLCREGLVVRVVKHLRIGHGVAVAESLVHPKKGDYEEAGYAAC